MTDFNPRSPDGERPERGLDVGQSAGISIHAPRMGSDEASAETCAWYKPFQSTLPGWGATICSSQPLISLNDFNPRSPDGERPPLRHAGTNVRGISIHAPRMGSDLDVCTTYLHRYKFQSTLPGWGATRLVSICRPRRHFNPRSPDGERPSRMIFPRLKRISIHAPRMGSDRERRTARTGSTHFNPRSPDGERRVTLSRVIGVSNFNPRSPDGERQSEGEKLAASLRFQSTLPGWGATMVASWVMPRLWVFQSTLPGWGATGSRRQHHRRQRISIHAPRMGSDL